MESPKKAANWIFGFTCLIILSAKFTQIWTEPTEYLSNNLQLSFIALIIAALLNSIFYARLRGRQSKMYRYLGRGLLILLVLSCLVTSFFLYQEMGRFALLTVLVCFIFLAGLLLGFAVEPVLKQKFHIPDIAVELGNTVLLAVFLLLFSNLMFSYEAPARSADENYTVYLEDGTVETYHLYHDELPLTLEDLRPDWQQVSTTRLDYSSSIAMDRTVCYQNAVPDELYQLDLCYEIVDMKLPGVAAICKNQGQDRHRLFVMEAGWYQFWLESYQQLKLPVDADVQVYQFYDEYNQPRSEYLLCWPERMVLLHYDGELGEREWSIILEKLGRTS